MASEMIGMSSAPSSLMHWIEVAVSAGLQSHIASPEECGGIAPVPFHLAPVLSTNSGDSYTEQSPTHHELYLDFVGRAAHSVLTMFQLLMLR